MWLYGYTPSEEVTTLPHFGDSRHCGSRYMMVLVYQLIQQDQVSKG